MLLINNVTINKWLYFCAKKDKLNVIIMKSMGRKFIIKSIWLFGFIVLISLNSCKKDDVIPSKSTGTFDNKVATTWFETYRTLTKKGAGFSPPVAARAFGYCGVTLYETVVPGIENGRSFSGQLSELTNLPVPDSDVEINYEIAANAALADAARFYYANMSDSLLNVVDELESSLEQEFATNTSAEIIYESRVYGKAMSAAIYQWSKTDGGHEGYLNNFPASYVVPTGDGYWVPTGPALIPLQPYWGQNRTFIANCAVNAQPDAPHTSYSEEVGSGFYNLANEVYTTGINLTQEQKDIAKYWSDDPGNAGTPPGHCVSIATQILKLENAKLDKAALTYALVGIAVSDAFVACWKCKFHYNLIRPVSYIKAHIDNNWNTLLSTPPFPEFTSGHSSQSAAFASVMTSLYGDNYIFTDYTHQNRTDINGSPRHFSSFQACADEAAVSRLYGGIHYREGNEAGKVMGNKIGSMVMGLDF